MQNIHGAEYPIKKVFSNDFEFMIPGYQRPYAWTTEEAGQLFDDLYGFRNQKESGETNDLYFLGSVVLIKAENNPQAEVIDGQQRLTTLTILLSVLAYRVSGDNHGALMQYIYQPGNPLEGLAPKPRLALRERDRAFFQKYIQTAGGIDELLTLNPKTLSDPQQNIWRNTELFVRKTEGWKEDEAVEFVKFIVNQCYLVIVSTPSMESAYRIFSVLNDRGLDLLPSDILKAEIIGKIPETQREQYTQKWEDVEEGLGREELSELLGHIRMIYRRAKQQKTILEEFRQYVLSEERNHKSFIDEILCPYARAYEIVLHTSYESTEHAAEVNQLIRWLLRIDNRDWIPPALSFLKRYGQDFQLTARFFKGLERLTASMFIRRCGINERIDRFGRLIACIQEGQDLWRVDSPLMLTEEEKRATSEALDGEVYLSTKTRTYVLLRLDSWLGDEVATYQHSIISVEHVLPQTVNPGSEWEKVWPDEEIRLKWVHRLGNLVLLSRSKNSSAQNYDFKTKKQKYFQTKGVSTFALTTNVLAESEWNLEVVEKRQQTLIRVLKKGWDL